ncbi:hypothetical protein BC835DRAFT_1412549 [Cytidiella melzeri]|nr:hypothetical protein BC835DRAFT_1412549 [Cytidiella melzeri]
MLDINYRLVIVAACVVISLILYLFYWNRILGYILSLAIRLLAWNQKESSIWVDIGSIHFSILGGRILLKDIRYHSSNQTIRVVKGQLSWRYWIRAPTDENDLSHARVVGESIGAKPKKTSMSCRVHICFQGLEWFIYNRTAAYDNIVASMESQSDDGGAHPDGRASMEAIKSLRKIFSWTSAIPDSTNLGPPISLVSSIYSRTPKFLKGWIAALKHQMPSLDPKDLLPIGIEVTKGAIVIGNKSTPTLFVADFKCAEGTYGIVPSRSRYDHYKQVINLKFQDAILHFVDNDRFDSSIISTGEKLHRVVQTSYPRPLRPFSYLTFNAFAKLWRRFKLWNSMSNRHRNSHFMHSGTASWGRRDRRKIVEEETPLGVDFSALEYAKETQIIEAPLVEFLYYADSVGQVPSVAEQSHATCDPFDIGNGDLPPEWGVDLAICGGVIRYGPWADRQRAQLVQTFFPSTFIDATPFVRLKPGDARVWPSMNVLIELKDGVTLQIPFREASKDWQWDGEVYIPNRPRKREAASCHLRAGDNSTISYIVPMVATSRGYEPSLNIHLDAVTVSSSLNDIRLLRAESCVIRCEMPNPLRWNEQRQWTFTISLRSPLIYILRDHVHMFTDLGKDWASGPPSDYDRFIPVVYSLLVEMTNYDLKMYVNDHNIIDKPLIPEDNAFLSFYGASLKQTVTVPLTKYRPQCSAVSFAVDAPDVGVSLTLPKWNTYSLFGKPHRSSELGRIGQFSLDASYCFFSEVHPENIDQLKLMFTGKDVVYKACGWTIRYFMSMRNNYFGSFTHFSTLYEYLEKRKSNLPIGDPVDLQYREGSSNTLQVELGLSVNNGLMVVPASLRGYELDDDGSNGSADIGTCVLMALPELQIQLRTHEYYMEVTLNIDSIATSVTAHCPEDVHAAWAIQRSAKEVLIVDGLDIVAHRLFGPMPRTSTYFCVWEFHVGKVAGCLDALEARTIMAAGRQFELNFTDPMNAPAQEYDIPTDPDVTFLKVAVDQFNLVWHVDNAAAELSLPKGLRLDFNDLAGKSHKSVTSVRVPQASVKLLLSRAAEMNDWHEAMNVLLDLNVDLYSAPTGWMKKAQAQAEFLVAQDSYTERVMFLYKPDQALPFDTLATGRGLLDTDFFLPQVRIPRLSNTLDQPKQDSRVVNSEHAPSPLALPRHLASYADSDGDDYESEADRDARIAKLRPVSHFTPPDDDDGSISSGDESDTEDSMYPDGSDSEADQKKELATTGSISDETPTISQYSPYLSLPFDTSKYTPVDGEPSLMVFSQDSTHCQQQSSVRKMTEGLAHATSDNPKAGSPCTSPKLAGSSTTVRISSRTGVFVILTPLVIPVLRTLSSDVVKNQSSPEICFDVLLSDHLQSVKDEEGDRTAATIMDTHFALVQVKLLQLLPFAPDLSGPDNAPARGRVPSSLELFLSGVRLRTAQSGATRMSNIMCSYDSVALGLGAAEHSSLAWDVVCSPSNFSLSEKDASVTLGDLFVNVSRLAPSQTTLMALRLAEFVDDMQEPMEAFRRGSMYELNRNTLFEALQRVEEKAVLDPLSTIQPSYLIQSGYPHRLRTDAGLKYLLFLRQHLQSMGPSLRDLFQPPDRTQLEKPFDAAIELLKRHLMDLAGDKELPYISPRSPLANLLRMNERAKDAAGGLSVDSVTLNLTHLHVICHSNDSVCSEFILRTVLVSLRSRSAACYQPYISNTAKSTTTLSLTKERGRQDVQHYGVIISVGDVALSIYPSLVSYAQTVVHTLKAHKLGPFGTKADHSRSVSRTRATDDGSAKIAYVDLVLTTRSIKFKAGAEKLLVEYKASTVDIVSTMLFKPPTQAKWAWDFSMNHSMTMDEIRLQAFAVADLSKPNEYGVLAAIIIGGARINALMRREAGSQQTLRATAGLDFINLNVPRSAIRLYRFMEEWRADYLPGLNATVQDLLSELHDGPQVPDGKRTQAPDSSDLLTTQLDIKISSFRVSLQVMRGTWLSWELGQIVTYALYTDDFSAKNALDFGLQIGTQVFVISAKEHASDSAPSVRMKIPLPTFSVTCHYNNGHIEGLALVEMFTANVKPSHWDTLLTVQQKCGQDFSDLVSIIEETRRKATPVKKEKSSRASSKYRILARMKGFRLGLESGSSRVLLGCDHIGGAINNDPTMKWHVELADLSLSLTPRSLNARLARLFDRSHRTAFVSIDARLEIGGGARRRGQLMKVGVSRTHAVMQPSSIGEMGDFVDHLQAEISMRKERRAQEMAEFKEKTTNLLRTLDITTQGSHPQPSDLSWIDHYTVDICLANIGVAFPLTFVQMPQTSIEAEGAVRAFLFSIKSITFGAQMGESGQASMKGFSFQFVSSFRQSNDRDFAGESHTARNRILYPEMTAQLRVERIDGSRQLHVGADVDGFILDIESSIPNYVSSLIEVYRHGKDRVERFANGPRMGSHPHEQSSEAADPVESNYHGLLTSNIFLSLTFESGRVRMFSNSYVNAARTRAISVFSREPSDEQFRELGVEVFDLPVVSVWGEYRATPAANKLFSNRGQIEPSTLLFKSTVHSSQNTLRPTLLPFLSEVVKNIEDRMKQTSKQDLPSFAVASPRVVTSHLHQEDVTSPVSSMQISLSLRIDQSKLELTCQPDVNVIAGLNWDSGGFVVNIAPGAHRVTFSGSVGGLTAGLKHGFLSEDCMKLHARNLSFTVDFAKIRGSTVSSVSVVCDTEFAGGVHFSRLQDILCFKAVWLDRIPVLNAPPSIPGGLGPRASSQLTTGSSTPPRQELTTAVIVRLREVRLDIDLGQSITWIKLDLRNAIFRTRMAEQFSELSLSFSEVSATASGTITGQMTVPRFLFQTTRKERTSADSGSKLLDLQMTSGPLVIDLESEYQKLLVYRAEPVDIRIYDDWSRFTLTVPAAERGVRLTFNVKGTDVTVVMSVITVPKLVSYANKFKATLDSQKEGASRESRAFRLANSPRPDNALSEVANAMFSSARSRLMEEPGFSGVIGQRLSLNLRTLRLVVFPRTMSDPELAQFIGSNVHARLDRVVESDALPPARDIQLSFTTISISKITSLNYPLVAKESIPSTNCQEWLSLLTKNASQATIFSLPAMTMRMHSDETVEDGVRVLPYDFTSKFANATGVREEDIYITLNMSLYSWLTVLRKTFTREMEQLQASSDVRAAAAPSHSVAARRSRAPEPLHIRQDRDPASGRSRVSSPQPVSPAPKGRPALLQTKSTPTRLSTMSPTSPEFLVTLASTSPHPPPATSVGTSFQQSPSPVDTPSRPQSPGLPANKTAAGLSYRARRRTIERLTLRQLGEATPDVMHPFFMKTAGFSLEDSLPQYVHEYATMPTEEIMKALLKLYSKQLKVESITEL